MGKNASSVSDWHRQQRKKELAKNKEARIKARDVRVVSEKTSREIQDEIRKLERQHKNVEQRPHGVQSKLDRLQKELKLVTAKEENDKKERNLTLEQQRQIDQQQQAIKTNFQPLENPKVSIYYDPLLNPFGAPPPGQPRLYHRRGGGVTMNLNEACTKEEQFLPPPPLPPPPPPLHLQQQQQQYNKSASRLPPPPPPPRNEALAQSKKTPTSTRHTDVPSDGKTDSTVPPPPPPPPPPVKKPMDPFQLPSLPKPSAAVERIHRSKNNSNIRLAADIWASTEEIEYEEAVTGTGLEGVVTDNNKSSSSTLPIMQWFYRDTAGQVQGPYTLETMLQWVHAGFFPTTTPVSASAQGPWNTMGQTKPFRKMMQPPKSNKRKRLKPPEAEPIDQSLQDRIAALRSETHHATKCQEIDETEESVMESTFTDRIADLRRERENVCHGGDDAGQGGIEAQGQQELPQYEGENDHDFDFNNKPEAHTVQDRIAALRAQHLSTTATTADQAGIPSPPPPPPATTGPIALPYPVDDNVVAYPATDGYNEVSAYPVDDADDLYDLPYPIDSMVYPVTGDYPVDAYSSADDDVIPTYAAISDYPSESAIGTSRNAAASQPPTALPPKKKVKIDRAVVSLLPSHLQKKRQSTVGKDL